MKIDINLEASLDDLGIGKKQIIKAIMYSISVTRFFSIHEPAATTYYFFAGNVATLVIQTTN